ncbi:unnamed protein product [Musa textilis]
MIRSARVAVRQLLMGKVYGVDSFLPLERRPRAFRHCDMSHLARISMDTRYMNYNGMFMVLCFCSRTTDALRSGFLLIPACFVCGFLCIETSKYLFRQIYLHFFMLPVD